jgi:hypothetical protein
MTKNDKTAKIPMITRRVAPDQPFLAKTNSIPDARPSGGRTNDRTEPANANHHRLPCRMYVPPTKSSTPIIVPGMPMTKIKAHAILSGIRLLEVFKKAALYIIREK